jgi:uncharacterized repeat protein (TIGR01451 family)
MVMNHGRDMIEARETMGTKGAGDSMKARSNATTTGIRAGVVALFAALLMAFALAPGADAAKVDNPSPPNFRTEITGGYLEVIGTSGTALGIPMDFSEFDLPNPAFAGSITTNAQGYGVINVPNNFYANCVPAQTPAAGGICFPPIPVAVDDIAVTVRILPVAAFTGFIDPLSGNVQISMPLRLKVEGSAMNQNLGNSCYIGSAGSPITLAMKTHVGNFPIAAQAPAQPVAVADFTDSDPGWIAAQPYTDEAGEWPAAPVEVPGFPAGGSARPSAEILANSITDFIARPAGSWRGVDETLIARAAEGCGLATDFLNGDIVGLPSSGNNSAAIDFRFTQFAARPDAADAIVRKAVKSRFTAPGISASPWPGTQKPTAVSAQSVTIDASNSYFKVGPHASERYRFDLGSGSYGPWTSDPVATFTAPTIEEGSPPDDLTIRVQVKDAENDVDTATRELTIVPATDISVDTTVSSVAGANLRGGSAGEIDLDVRNNSANDASSLPLRLTASLPAGVTMTGFQKPAAWTCENTTTAIDCTLPQNGLPASGTSHFDLSVQVDADAPSPGTINANVAMAGDPSPGNNTDNLSVNIVKTDLALDLTRPEQLVANGWFPYEIDVENVGDGVTVGGSTVNVSLPSDFTFRAQGSGGEGWTCGAPANPQSVVCSRSAEIQGNSSAPLLTVWARVDRNTPAEDRTVNATVTTQADIDAFGGANTDSDTGAVQIAPDLAADVSVSGGFVVGDPGTVTLSATNESVVDIDGPTTITSDLPAGITVASVSGSGWDCSATETGGSEISCVMADGLDAGQSSPPVNVTVDVAQASYPGITIPAALSNEDDAFVLNDSDTAEVQVRRLDVAIQKLAVRPFNVGIEGRYRLNVTNVGDTATVGDITVTDQLPAGLTLNGASGAGWDCSDSQVGGSDIECVLTSAVGPGVQAAPIEARVTVLDEAAEVGTVTNTAYVDTPRDTRGVAADEAVTGNNTSTVNTPAVAVDLSIESAHQGAFRVGTDDLYSLTIRNVGFFGTDPGEPVIVTDDLPDGIVPLVDEIEITRPGWACGEDDGDVICTLEAPDENTSAMAPESAVTIDIPVRITDAAADNSVNVAQVTTARDSNPELSPNNIANDPTTVTRIDLALTGEVSIQPRVAGIGQVTLELANVGSAATVNPSVVVVPLANDTSYRPNGSTTTGWACSSPGAGTQISCVRNQSIPAGGTAPVLRLRTNNGTGAPAEWTTEASVSSAGEPAERLANNEVSLEQTLETIDLEITRTHDPAAVKAGKRASATIRVENVGNTASNATIRVEETVHASFENVTASGQGWSCPVTGNSFVCTRTAAVAAGASAPDITVGFDIPADQAGTRNASATVSSTDDPFTSNNTATDPVQIVSTADIAVDVDQPEFVRVGDTIDVTYRVRNVGTQATSGSPSVTLRIAASDGLVPIEGNSNGDWNCDAVAATGTTLAHFDCELADPLEAGDDTTMTGEFEVTSSAESELGTLAIVSTPGELNRSNNGASAFSTVRGIDLETTVEAPVDHHVAGTSTNRIVHVQNVGSTGTTAGITVKVPLPAGVTWNTEVPVGSAWNCDAVPGAIISCEHDEPVAAGGTIGPLTLGLIPSRSNAPELTMNFIADTAGDENAGNSTATRTDVVRYEPETTITSGPSGTVTSRNATVAFTSDDETATFECRLDSGAFEPCTSPKTYSSLGIGQHAVTVRAVNQYGMTDATPARSDWTVESGSKPTGSYKNVRATLREGNLSLATLGSVPLPAEQIKLTGKRYDNGALVIPASGVEFLPVIQTIEDAIGDQDANVEISISATGDGEGTLPKDGGPASLVLPVRADVKATLGALNPVPEGTECALKPVSFDLSGTFDAASKTMTLSSPSVGFPTLTGCGTFGPLIDGLIGLPRNDIELSTTFGVEELPDDACPPNQTGTPPDCVDIPAGQAKLSKPKVKVKKSVKSGKPVTITARVKNTGDTAAKNVKVCLTLKKAKKLAKGKAKRCKTIRNIAPGATGKARFKVKTKKVRARKKLKFTVNASAAGVPRPKQYAGNVKLRR